MSLTPFGAMFARPHCAGDTPTVAPPPQWRFHAGGGGGGQAPPNTPANFAGPQIVARPPNLVVLLTQLIVG